MFSTARRISVIHEPVLISRALKTSWILLSFLMDTYLLMKKVNFEKYISLSKENFLRQLMVLYYSTMCYFQMIRDVITHDWHFLTVSHTSLLIFPFLYTWCWLIDRFIRNTMFAMIVLYTVFLFQVRGIMLLRPTW